MADRQHNTATGDELHVPGYVQSSDPGAVGAGKLWIDTTLGSGKWAIKIRNASNTAWEVIGSVAAFISNTAIRVFTSSDTYTPTAGMKYCVIECIGGGGGGGGVTTSGGGTAAGGGGGGGGYSRKIAPSATIGASQSVTIGAAGTAGTTSGSNGGDGGTTSVGTLCSAPGGKGGTGATGTGINGGTSQGGGVGDFVIASTSGGFGPGSPSAGGYGVGGSSGDGDVAAARAGHVGSGYGAGGGGARTGTASTSAAGGAGTGGLVIITEYL